MLVCYTFEKRFHGVLLGTCLLCLAAPALKGRAQVDTTQVETAQEEIAPEHKVEMGEWNGYAQERFQVAGRQAYVVTPSKAAEGRPWIWRARFPNYHAEMDIELLAAGFHVAYVDVAGLFGAPQAVEIGDIFYEYVLQEYSLATKPCLEGVSRGGLFVYNWVAKNPDKVACIYCDTPVCDINSWPGGRGNGVGSKAAWQQCLKAYRFSEEQASAYFNQPIHSGKVIASAQIPILHIVSENDTVVPPAENTYRLRDSLQEHGHALAVISVERGTTKSNGHHFDHPSPERVVAFIKTHTQPAK